LGQALSNTTFVYDPDQNGAIDATDVATVKSSAGLAIP
jgi:hypothetical protein